jgi:hypothetical protein
MTEKRAEEEAMLRAALRFHARRLLSWGQRHHPRFVSLPLRAATHCQEQAAAEPAAAAAAAATAAATDNIMGSRAG